jgi:amino acid adenylation domain-containing protein
MSDIEKGMIYYSLRDTVPTVYYNQVVYQLEHPGFDERIFKKAFEWLVRKHSILRTAFDMEDFEEPVQIVFKEVPLDSIIRHDDISHLDRVLQEDHIEGFLKKDRARPFDIKRPESLWRVKTFLVDNENVIFIWIGHHALIDGWSSASLVTELNNTYLSLKTNPDFVPGPLNASYKDFIIEQQAAKKNSETIEYWKRELDNYKRLEFPRPSKTGNKPHKTKTIGDNLGAHLLESLTASAKKYNTTVKTVCFAAYLYMLNMLSYENDIVAGLVTNNRPNCEDGDKIIGCFLNTVPVRLKIPARISCADYIESVDVKMLELKRYEKMPLFEILRITGEETREQNPLFDTLFNFVDFFVYNQLDSPGGKKSRGRQLQIEGSGSINTLFNFDVNITMGNFLISLSYSDALIHDELALNCLRFFETFLKRFIHEPEHLLEKGDLLSEEEKQDLLVKFNSSEAAYPHDKTLHELFATQVEKTPDHIAVVGKAQSAERRAQSKTRHAPCAMRHALSYRELAERSGYPAYLLREKGVQPGTVVGIKVGRSLEMVIGILGILRAGGAYLPIDPDYPRERIDFMLNDSDAGILLTDTSSEGHHFNCQLSIVNYQLLMSLLKTPLHHSSFIEIPHHSGSLAYIIYTSGTTGRPKGVLVEHRNAVNTVSWFGRQYRVRPGVRLLMMSDYTFDASVNQVFGTLLHGAVLHIIHPEQLSDIHGLRQLIEQRGIHIINFVPTFLTELLAGKEKLKSLQVVISGAEPLGEGFKEEMLGKGYALYNHYGPTETTIDALSCRCTDDAVTLGKPISNVHCFILDNQQALLPVGVVGELFIAGPGVARGYLNQPDLTAEKFNRSYKSYRTYILYKTGDLARWLPDGNIEFLGRIDRQVKIRGYRIELEEIENKLLDHEQIKEAVVLVNETAGEDKTLCAYVVARSTGHGAGKSIVGLQEYLTQRLPGYMIPSRFIHLDALPLTPVEARRFIPPPVMR